MTLSLNLYEALSQVAFQEDMNLVKRSLPSQTGHPSRQFLQSLRNDVFLSLDFNDCCLEKKDRPDSK